jgi:hypothetical protein
LPGEASTGQQATTVAYFSGELVGSCTRRAGKLCINVTLKRVRVTIVAVEKQ